MVADCILRSNLAGSPLCTLRVECNGWCSLGPVLNHFFSVSPPHPNNTGVLEVLFSTSSRTGKGKVVIEQQIILRLVGTALEAVVKARLWGTLACNPSTREAETGRSLVFSE